MDYKLVGIDMDGTLLGKKGIGKRTRKTLRRVENNGVEVVIATGRILQSALYHYNDIGLKGRVIACNGGLIVDGQTGDILYEAAIREEEIIKLAEIGNDLNLSYNLYSRDSLYRFENKKDRSDKFYNYQKQFSKEGINVVNIDSLDELDLSSLRVYKMIIIENDREKLKEAKSRLSEIKSISLSSSWNNNIEIMSKNVSKGKAIERICKDSSIELAQVISFGDNENDLDMIEKSGLGVAMGNSIEKLKERADLIAKSNDEEGVAIVLEKYILTRED